MSDYGTVSDMAIGIGRAWKPYQDLILSLTPDELDGPTDDAGWTVKDHIGHVTAWETGIMAVLQGRPRHEGMGISEDEMDMTDIDAFNARVREAFADVPAEEIVEEAQLKHEGFMMELEALPEEAVRWPLHKFLPEARSTGEKRLAGDWFWNNSGGHFTEHLGYIEAILDGTG